MESQMLFWPQLSVRIASVFIPWLGWSDFNAGSQLAISGDNACRCRYYYNYKYRSSNRALAAMFVTWAVYGKPDISMTLNGVLFSRRNSWLCSG
jgi:ammonia channel protein AmtB